VISSAGEWRVAGLLLLAAILLSVLTGCDTAEEPSDTPGTSDNKSFADQRNMKTNGDAPGEADMTTDIPEAARPHLEEADRLITTLIAGLDDESRPAMERMASVAEEGKKIEAALQSAMAAGLTQDHPAFVALMQKGDQIGSKLEELSKAGAAEVAATPEVTSSEKLGREAAQLEKQCYQEFVDLLADRPAADEVGSKVAALRDEWVRKVWAMGEQRAALDDKGRRDFQWGLINELKEAKELRGKIGGELWSHYQGTPILKILEEVYNLNRFLDPKRLSDSDRERLKELGIEAEGGD
jgi:hypothetical protein